MNTIKTGVAARRAGTRRLPDHANVRWTAIRPARAVCTRRSAAITGEQVMGNTWTDGLRDLGAHLEEAARGMDVRQNLKQAGTRLSILYGMLTALSYDSPCCLEANPNKVVIARCLNALRWAGRAFQEACAPTRPGRDPLEREGLIRTVLKAIPEEEELSRIVSHLRAPFCACPECERTFSEGHVVFECGHCHSIVKTGD